MENISSSPPGGISQLPWRQEAQGQPVKERGPSIVHSEARDPMPRMGWPRSGRLPQPAALPPSTFLPTAFLSTPSDMPTGQRLTEPASQLGLRPAPPPRAEEGTSRAPLLTPRHTQPPGHRSAPGSWEDLG